MMSFADELAAFQARTTNRGFDGLILLGTRQATTAALLIGALALKHVAFLLTDATRELPQQVATLLNCSADTWLCLPGDHSTTLSVYQGLRLLMEEWADLERTMIAVDVTGGLKPMSVGLEKAAHLLGLTTIYIESDYGPGPDGRFGPLAGTQRLILPPDPYTVFGDLEAAEAQRLYAAHDYAGAQRLFATLAARVPPPTNARYADLAKLASAYVAWDAFDLPQAHACLSQLLANYHAPHWPEGTQPHITEQRDALTLLTSAQVSLNDTPYEILAHNLDAVLALLGSLYANALRREAQQRYDVAALLLYRCLELMSQRRLATHGINADADRIMLMKGYGKLDTLRDPLVWNAADSLARGQQRLLDRIRQTNAARNKSILAHGFRLIRREQEYLPFRSVVDEVFERFFIAEQVAARVGRDRAAWHALFDAPELE